MSYVPFLIITGVLGGLAAWMTGRAVAGSWKPMWLAVLYMVPLALAARFFNFALADGVLLSLPQLLLDFAVLASIAAASHRMELASRMVRQYPWVYRRTSPFSWTAIDGGAK